MKILLAIDSLASSDLIVNEVAARAWPKGAAVCVLKVVEAVAPCPGVPDAESPANAETQALVESTAEQFVSRGIEADWKIIEGNPQTSIVEYARHWGADFIFVGSHRDHRLTPFSLGSVARAVVQNASCSVEIVRHATNDQRGVAKRGTKILLATDGSDFSLAATRSVAARPWPEGSRVKVVSVVDPTEMVIGPMYGIADAREIKIELMQAALSAAVQILSNAGWKAAGAVLEGDPKVQIIEEAKAWGANLIVVGSHGRSGIKRLWLGNTSEAIVMHAHCSVEIIRKRIHFGGD